MCRQSRACVPFSFLEMMTMRSKPVTAMDDPYLNSDLVGGDAFFPFAFLWDLFWFHSHPPAIFSEKNDGNSLLAL